MDDCQQKGGERILDRTSTVLKRTDSCKCSFVCNVSPIKLSHY